MTIDKMASDANDRVQLFITRSASQHSRRMREHWPDAECIEITTEPAPLDPPGARGNVVYVGDEPGLRGWIRRIFGGVI